MLIAKDGRRVSAENHPLRQMRRRVGMTATALAKRSGISRRTIIYIEHFDYMPHYHTRRKLLKAFGLPFEKHVEVFESPRVLADANR